ncbi:unnamed protein product [Sympodiomycopsis kandeliae]
MTTSEEENQAQESAHFHSVLETFDSYLRFSLAANNLRRRSYNVLPRRHRDLLNSLGSTLPAPILEGGDQVQTGQGFQAKLDEIDDRIRRNAAFLELVVLEAKGLSGSQPPPPPPSKESNAIGSSHDDPSDQIQTPKDLEKVRSILKQLVRDWSNSGSTERYYAYSPFLTALEELFSSTSILHRSEIKVLTPGCGLGRLSWEIAMKGFSSQGNEFSFFMLIISHFILNNTSKMKEFKIYPWIHSASNWRNSHQMLKMEEIPDVNPNDLLNRYQENNAVKPPDFEMVAGDFIPIYSSQDQKEKYNAVCTCFFLDTAHNPIAYLEVINHVLPLGAYWINLGPLLWHFEGQGPSGGARSKGHGNHNQGEHQQGSIELTLDEVVDLVGKMGFKIIQQKNLPRQSYTGHTESMLTYEYQCEFWIAQKVADVDIAS